MSTQPISTPSIWTIPHFWSAEKCIAFIERSEQMGYKEALVETESGPRKVTHIRNNERVLFTDTALAQSLWSAVKSHIPAQLGNSRAVGLNELIRCYKYQPGHVFRRHRDQSFLRDNGDASYLTLMIYLNDTFEGGSTRFQHREVLPEQGTCLLFLHDLEHEGTTVVKGTKYVLRTDVMYRFQDNNE